MRRFAVDTTRNCAVAVAAVLLASSAGAESDAADSPNVLPINLDASSSEIDRLNGHVMFHGLKISQGQLLLQAETAEASRLDFDDSRWIFRGGVVLDNGTTKVSCEEAELTFIGHQLRVALMKGAPARFEQYARVAADKEPPKGRANVLDYNLDSGLMSLSGDAWVTDGSNEVSGERLSYDLRKKVVLADSSDGRQVRMRFNPPPRKGTTGKAP